ncbi:hypothetical protein JCM24511_10162 [Saitozyma sp. JCM 24511]|nr:hypothetical protein JCM24511_10162 [Saitozyma sp. JCM 24511]
MLLRRPLRAKLVKAGICKKSTQAHNEDAFPYLFLDNAPLGSKHYDVRVYLVLAKKQGPTEMGVIVRTSLPFFYRLHGKLPLVAFSSGFCGSYRREGQKADTLGVALGAMGHRSGDKITEAGLEPYVETVEPEGWEDWNDLAGAPELWNSPEKIRGLDKPK